MNCLRIFAALLLVFGWAWAGEGARENVESNWTNLDSPEASVREAARKAIEAQPLETWKSRAIGETRPWASIEALFALCEACPLPEGPALRPHLCEGITTLRIEEMDGEQLLATLRLTRLVCTRFGKATEDERQQMIDLWSRVTPQAAGKEDPQQKEIAREMKEMMAVLERTR